MVLVESVSFAERALVKATWLPSGENVSPRMSPRSVRSRLGCDHAEEAVARVEANNEWPSGEGQTDRVRSSEIVAPGGGIGAPAGAGCAKTGMPAKSPMEKTKMRARKRDATCCFKREILPRTIDSAAASALQRICKKMGPQIEALLR
jgi:hypothetical protein